MTKTQRAKAKPKANELDIIAGFILRAQCPEDAFGELPGLGAAAQGSKLRHAFNALAKAVHPDLFVQDPASQAIAQRAFQELEQLREEARARITDRTYGQRRISSRKAPLVINGKYVLQSSLGSIVGDIADLHPAYLESSTKQDLLVKIARLPIDNELLRTEQDTLSKMHEKLPKASWGQCVPKISDSFLLGTSPTTRRRANVMTAFTGFRDAAKIAKLLPQGVDAKTIAWMWKRLLMLLDWTHHIGFVHGAVLPPHVMYYPDNDGGTGRDIRKHSVRLVDWCYAVPVKGSRLKAWLPEYEAFYPPEVKDKKPVGPWTDLYMGAQTMLHLLGIEPSNDGPSPVLGSITSCLHKDPKKRPQDAGDYFKQFDKILRDTYGAPRYHLFNLPESR